MAVNSGIAITLPEDIELKDFQFEYYTRKAEYHSLHGIPAKLSISSNVAEGKCGENLFWKLKVNGELSISGNGEMGYSEWRPIPWDGYRDAIKKVTLDKGIVSIVDEAFLNCANLTSIELPNNLTSMDLHAKNIY